MALRVKLQFMVRPDTYKIVYRPQLRFGSYGSNLITKYVTYLVFRWGKNQL